jgi:hypothetical protein
MCSCLLQCLPLHCDLLNGRVLSIVVLFSCVDFGGVFIEQWISFLVLVEDILLLLGLLLWLHLRAKGLHVVE